MSLVDLLGYNVLVDKINHVIRGILVGVSMITLMLLLVSSDWVPLNRLLNKSKSAINSGDLLDASYALAHAAQYSPSKFDLLEDAGLLAWESGDAVAAKSYLMQGPRIPNLVFYRIKHSGGYRPARRKDE